MEYLRIAILALIQGAAELLPVSSSAHVIVAERLMGLDPSTPEMTFLLVMLHTGTMFAVLFYFWPRWRSYLFTAPATAGRPPVSRFHFLGMVVLATAATGVVGLTLQFFIEKVILGRLLGREKGEIEDLFRSLPLIGTALFLVGLFIIAAGRWAVRDKDAFIGTRAAVLIG